jgi:hypothetical protein
MNAAVSEAHARAIRGAVATISAAGAIVALLSFSLPIAAACIVVAAGVVIWSYRKALPTLRQLLFLATLAAALGFGIAWYEETRVEKTYDFVVVPKNVVAIQYAFPGPRHESTSSPVLGYGDHVEVDCYLQGYDNRPWLALTNGNFMPAGELTPAELSSDDPPPSCDSR